MIRLRNLFFLLLLLLNACTFRFIYNHSDTLFIWRIDDFFDLTREQERFLKPRIMSHVEWHRDNEVQAYIDFLKQAQIRIQDQVSQEDMDWFYAAIRPFKANLGKRLQEDAVNFFAGVREKQLRNLKQELEEENEEFIERIAMTPEKRQEKKAEVIIDKLEKWTGSLSREQEKQILALTKQLPDVTEQWLEYRRSRQQEFVNIVQQAREGDAGGTAGPALYEWFTRSRPEKFRSFFAATDTMAVQVDKLLTSEQRDHVVAEIQEWIDDMETVLANRSSVPKAAFADDS